MDDCYVLGPIAALAQSDPEAMEKLIEEQEDGSYKVTLYLRTDPNSNDRQETTIVVKKEFVRDKKGKPAYAGRGDQELWVQVLEKAYAQALGSYKYLSEGGDATEFLEVLTNKKAIKALIKKKTKEEVWTLFRQALTDKQPVVVNTSVLGEAGPMKLLPDGQQLQIDHVYYLKKVNAETIVLQNPSGRNHLTITWEILLEYFVHYSIL